MNTTGALVLFVGLGVLLIAGISGLSSLHSEVNTTNENNSEIQAQNSMMQDIENPLFMVFGYGLLIVAAIMLVNAFRSM